jgi:hypothetical protein
MNIKKVSTTSMHKSTEIMTPISEDFGGEKHKLTE